MAHTDLREFIKVLEKRGELKRVSAEVDPVLEITELADRAVKSGAQRHQRTRFSPVRVKSRSLRLVRNL